MAASTSQRLVLYATTLCVWLIVAATATYWILQINAQQVPAPLPVAATFKLQAVDTSSVAKVLGALAPQAETVVPASSRFALKGVISGALGKEAALIAIDNKPAITFKVGSSVEEGLILQSASARKVILSATRDGSAVMTLEMPLLDK
jgi:general secretion pathway protein C